MIGLVLAAALVGAPAETAAAAPTSGVITNPDWLELPSADDMSHHFPNLALQLEVGGSATIQCEVNEVGRLEACEAITEQPAGFGFGAAAVASSEHFQMKPRLLDGRPVRSDVRVPIRFSLPEEEADASEAGGEETAQNTAPPSPEALRLARRLVALEGGEQVVTNLLALSLSDDGERLDPAADLTLERDYLQLQADVLESYRGRLLEPMVASLASVYTEAELGGLVAFYEGPVGRAFLGKRTAVLAGQFTRTAEMMTELTQEIRTRFCAKHDCGTGGAEAGGNGALEGVRP